VFLSFLHGTRVNGNPSANDLAKAAISDGLGPHTHDGSGPHEHGEPTFTDDEATFLASQGLHVDRHHGRVSDEDGFRLSPPTVSSMLATAREDGLLKIVAGPVEMTKVSSPVVAGGTAPGEGSPPESGSPVVQHLDLRGRSASA
jgi:hypothetical protein